MGIMFFEKNKADLDKGSDVTITVTDSVATNNGQSFVDQLRDRKNDTGHATTGSTDAAGTTYEVNTGDAEEVSDIFLLRNNFKAFTLKYWNGSAWTDFSPAVNETTNSQADYRASFTTVTANRFQLQVTATFEVDDDKFLSQFVITKLIGEFTTQPEIAQMRISKNRRTIKALSGKSKVQRSVGSVSCVIRKRNVTDDADLTVVERLHDSIEGFLVWLSGGDTAQFNNERIGYRRQDLFLMNIASEYEPTWEGGHYKHGIPIDMALVEVT